MKVSPTQIEEIRNDFATMKSRQDLVALLNKAKGIIYGEKTVPLELKQLCWYANPKRNQKRYKEFVVRKRSGGERVIHAPVKGLKSIQRALAFILQCVYEPHQAATGFVWGKSIVDNAKIHVGARYVYNTDLKDFFPSVDQARVWKCLQLEPFNLNDSTQSSEQHVEVETGIRRLKTDFNEIIYYKVVEGHALTYLTKMGDFKKYRERLTSHIPKPVQTGRRILKAPLGTSDYERKIGEIIFEDTKRYVQIESNIKNILWSATTRLSLANVIASLCCTEIRVERLSETEEWVSVSKNVLPQGAPTSPVLTNVICQRLDRRLTGVAKRFGLKYSRYADDITFSSIHNEYEEDGKFLTELNKVIKDQGFFINEAKTRLQKDGYRKEVTGLIVNEKVNVSQRYIKQIRLWLYYWERYGYDRAYSFFLQQYGADKGHVKKGKPNMANVIAGKLDYLKMVKGEENEGYLKLRGRFTGVIRVVPRDRDRQKHLDLILEKLLTRGLESAMDLFQPNDYGKKK